MSAQRPTPLTPPECSMEGNDWFPLHFDRLRNSRWWRRASDTARARNVMLWGPAYMATPAGSLSNDDDDLAEAAGYGMDVESFLKVKDEIMSCWVLCSDNRFYHPMVCEVAMDTWDKMSERRKKDAARKAASRARVRSVPAGNGNVTRDAPSEAAPVTAKKPDVTPAEVDVTRDAAEKPRDIATHNRRGEEILTSSLRSDDAISEIEGIEDQTKRGWSMAIFLLVNRDNASDKSARGVVGKLLKETGATGPELFDAAKATWDHGTLAPVPYLRKALQAMVDRRGDDPIVRPGPKPATSDIRAAQRKIVADFKADPSFWPHTRGPRPDEPGCTFPADILAEFGFGDVVNLAEFE